MTPAPPPGSAPGSTFGNASGNLSRTAAAALDVAALVALLQRQNTLYQNLRALSDQQAGLIRAAQTESLLTLLARRQRLIEDATAVSTELDPYRKAWPVLWGSMGANDRRVVGDLVARIQELIGIVVQQDERDRQSLSVAKGRVSSELMKLARSSTATNAYRAIPSVMNNRFTNRQG